MATAARRTDFLKQAEADAAALGITVREALALEFAARAALAHMGRNVKAEAIFTVAAQHSCFRVIDDIAIAAAEGR